MKLVNKFRRLLSLKFKPSPTIQLFASIVDFIAVMSVQTRSAAAAAANATASERVLSTTIADSVDNSTDNLTREEFVTLVEKYADRFRDVLIDNRKQEPGRQINFPNLESLPADVSLHNFATWRKKWNDYCRLQRISTYPRLEQISALRLVLSTRMLDTVDTVLGIDEATVTPDDILDRIQQHIRTQRNVALDRVDFHECRQTATETFDEFYIRIQGIAALADLCKICLEQQMTTGIIAGIYDKRVRRKLLALNPFPRLQQTIDICRSEESASRNEPILSRSSASVNRVDEKSDSKTQQQGKFKPNGNCGNCGKPHGKGENCPAKGKVCTSCNKKNHFASVCRSKGKASDNQSSAESPTPGKIGSIKVLHTTVSRPVPTITIGISRLNDHQMTEIQNATPDCGAGATVAGLGVLHQLNEDENNLLFRGEDSLEAANGQPIKSSGRLNLRIQYGGKSITTQVIFSPEVTGILLSWFACVDLGILPPQFPAPISTSVHQINCPPALPPKNSKPSDVSALKEQLLNEFADVFDGAGPLKTMSGPPMIIELLPDAVPYAVPGARPIPFAQREQVKNMLDDMMAQGIIAPISTPTDWIHPLVVVGKPNGKIRICVDLTKLNQFVKRPLHPLVSPKDAVSRI